MLTAICSGIGMFGFFEFLKSAIFLVGYISNNQLFPEPLSTEEEKFHLDRMADGNEESKNILIERNLRLVAHICKKYTTTNVEPTEPVEEKNPCYTEVIRNNNVVIVYGLDSNNNYTKVQKVFVSSVGKDNGTPTGTFTTTDKYVWRALFGNVYGQYATRITGSILFHSVPYTSQSKDSLEWDEYNKLGTAASMGCVRMAVGDVKWLYDNCPSGMTVKIYDGDIPKGITKPESIKIDENSPNKGWDPTDPDLNNPWK